jgi:hypothetical protein
MNVTGQERDPGSNYTIQRRVSKLKRRERKENNYLVGDVDISLGKRGPAFPILSSANPRKQQSPIRISHTSSQ